MPYTIDLPGILLAVPRNPVTAVGLPLLAGILSGYPTRRVVRGQWYNNLKFPPGRPPRQVFPVAWTMLYISMGWASHLAVVAYDEHPSGSSVRAAISRALLLYCGQLALNYCWTPLFFVKKKVILALLDSSCLLGVSCYMTVLLHNATSGETTWFLAPYCTWLAFATYLNGGIWWLNKDRRIAKYD